jgi:hypothetical protein
MRTQKFGGIMTLVTAGITLLIGIIVLGLLITNLDSSITLTGTANTTYHNAQTIIWAGISLGAVAIIVIAAVLILSLFR